MRSAFDAFSLPISTPQLPMILSSSLAVRAATQGADSICSSADGSVPVAACIAWGSTANSKVDIVKFRISFAKACRIEFPTNRRRFNTTASPQINLILRSRASLRGVSEDSHTGAPWFETARAPPDHGEISIHLQRDAAVDHQFDAGDVFRFVGGEKQRRVGDI